MSWMSHEGKYGSPIGLAYRHTDTEPSLDTYKFSKSQSKSVILHRMYFHCRSLQQSTWAIMLSAVINIHDFIVLKNIINSCDDNLMQLFSYAR